MYEGFFELSGRPFPTTPDVGAYFPAAAHEEALTLLKCVMNDGEAVGVLLGAPGIGKTLLCHQLIDALDPTLSLVFLNNINNPSIESLLQAILHDLSLPFESGNEQALRLRLTDFLMERFSQGGKTIIFIDEAQNLSVAQLEELRLLTNLEGRSEKAVQILLIGQERLAQTLAQESLAGLCQRIAVTARLRPLTDEETMEYVRAHINRRGGAADSIFTASALSEICEYASGIPRRINQICHRALTLAFAHQCGTIDGEYVHMAASQLFLAKPDNRVESHHVSMPSAPRRLFDDLAFDASDRWEERPRAEKVAVTHSTPNAAVVEFGNDQNWGSPPSATTETTTLGGSFEIGPSWMSHSADETVSRTQPNPPEQSGSTDANAGPRYRSMYRH